MLLQFTIKNHYSFHNETTFDMVATNSKEHEYSLIECGTTKVLPVAAIYGANGAGKSNFIDSFFDVINFMLRSIEFGKEPDTIKHPFVPFLFANNPLNSVPLESEIIFLLDGIEYRYGFCITNDEIVTEYLDCIPQGKKSFVKIFLREKGKKHISVGTSPAVTDWERDILKVIGPVLNDTDLALTFLCRRQGDNENHRYKRIHTWLRSIRRPRSPFNLSGELRFSRDSDLKQLYDEKSELYSKHLTFIQKADPAIQKLSLRERKGQNGTDFFEVCAKHRLKDSNETVEVPVGIESDGTKAAIRLYPALLTVLDNGGILVVDELDRSLHPLLLLDIIQMFTNPEINIYGAQLICSLHTALVMDKKHLRRDEIWFVEKNSFGESELFSLADVIVNDKKIRGDADYCKQYILGTFGAVPSFLNI